MSMHAFPFLFLNLGGEMMYILDQRLTAQNIPRDKAQKVLNDIASTMLSRGFMDEIFKPQDVYTKRGLRTVFDKLAHTSIMRLNTASMDKLYDLMTMALKYQVYMCSQPSQILQITLNHLDNMRGFVSLPNVQQQVFDVYSLLMKNFGSMKGGGFQLIRQTLMVFFQDTHVKVSIFLRDKVQIPNGRFVMPTKLVLPNECQLPGRIEFMNENGEVMCTCEFDCGGNYTRSGKKGSLEFAGQRSTTLGTNMYSVTRIANEVPKTETVVSQKPVTPTQNDLMENRDESAKGELNYLADLLGNLSSSASNHEFRLNLFNTDNEEEMAVQEQKQVCPTKNVINIDASQPANEALTKIIGEMNVSEESVTTENQNPTENLLDLMDLAASK